ncbi:MAG: folate family ECF transporter S component [Ruminococcaceae bacterium]|nr:folate family ECF transporter S component [Oscillospiraceae bacterium]
MNKRFTLRVIVYSALLVAIEVVLNRFCSINTIGLKIGFGFVPIVVAAIMFGPIPAAVVYGLADLIGSLLFPIGPYFPGFTVSAVIMGAVYGLFLYKKPSDVSAEGKPTIKFFPNIVMPVLINSIAIGLFINTGWVSILSGQRTYWGWFIYRIPEYLILIPVNLVLIPIIYRICGMLKKTVFK